MRGIIGLILSNMLLISSANLVPLILSTLCGLNTTNNKSNKRIYFYYMLGLLYYYKSIVTYVGLLIGTGLGIILEFGLIYLYQSIIMIICILYAIFIISIVKFYLM